MFRARSLRRGEKSIAGPHRLKASSVDESMPSVYKELRRLASVPCGQPYGSAGRAQVPGCKCEAARSGRPRVEARNVKVAGEEGATDLLDLPQQDDLQNMEFGCVVFGWRANPNQGGRLIQLRQ